MKLKGNTILITGGGSGIGRGLAEAFHAKGNQVIISGRREQQLAQTTAANSGMASFSFDVENPASILTFAEKVISKYPDLNVLINNAGIMNVENLLTDSSTTTAEAIITTNLLGPIRMTAAFLPHLLKKQQATIINNSSGLATVPLAYTPTYCATKAAIHSYTESLRYQLRNTSVKVLELVPPYVATELMAGGTFDPHAMPLNDFISEVIQILETEPTPREICVTRVKDLRDSVANGTYDAVFEGLNQSASYLAEDSGKLAAPGV